MKPVNVTNRSDIKVFVHPTALVDVAAVGDGTQIWAYSHVLSGVSIGRDCRIEDHCFLEGGVVVGDYVTIKVGNVLWEGITLEEGVFVGPRVLFTNDRYPRSARYPVVRRLHHAKTDWLLPTLVKRGASLGAGSVILPGITIGEFALVAAGSVVTKDVPGYGLVMGNPARLSGWVCQCAYPLSLCNALAVCTNCGCRFREVDGVLVAIEEADQRD